MRVNILPPNAQGPFAGLLTMLLNVLATATWLVLAGIFVLVLLPFLLLLAAGVGLGLLLGLRWRPPTIRAWLGRLAPWRRAWGRGPAGQADTSPSPQGPDDAAQTPPPRTYSRVTVRRVQ